MITKPFRILTVCTMNICRSPAMEQQLQECARQWEQLSSGPVEVTSAGTNAVPGAPNCEITLAHLGASDWRGQANKLTAELLTEADLVLTAATSHISNILALNPSARSQTFTLKQAARLTQSITEGPALATAVAKASGELITPTYDEPHTLTEPLPTNPSDRLTWLVTELDAIRGTVPVNERDNLDWDPDDIPDPHVLGFELHQNAADLIGQAVNTLSTSIQQILTANVDSVRHHD